MALEEVSMNFDLEEVEPLLVAVARLVDDGFSEGDARRLARDIAALPLDAELTRHYSVSFQGSPMPLRVEAYMDDIEATDLALFAPDVLAQAIDQETTAYFE